MATPRIPKDAAQKDVDAAPDSPDLKTRLEEQSYLLAKARTRLVQARVKSVRQDINERKKYAAKIFSLICCWVGGLFVLLVLSSWSTKTSFLVPSAVLLTLIGSTTATVLGLFYIVAHYLFPDRGSSSDAVSKEHDQADKST